MQTQQWDILEIELQGPDIGNPFLEVELSATFSLGHRTVAVDGFYDGDGIYRIRFMPDTTGVWSYVTHSNVDALAGATGAVTCVGVVSPASGVRDSGGGGAVNHGPVRVKYGTRFAYEDGTPYQPVGTTCYVWNHQGDATEEKTLETLKAGPFNKVRMCVFPKSYDFNKNEPEYYPFEGTPLEAWDFERFDPAFFQHLERCIGGLMDLGVEADLILFHPYDRWGFSKMSGEVDDRYLRYIVARLAAYRNVWWSFANEFDLMQEKNEADWDRYFRIVQQYDPYSRLRSIHNCRGFYDHNKPWVTHCSVQHHELRRVSHWLDLYRKPVVVDECGYEGNIVHDWGNLTPQEMSNRFWIGFSLGGYVGHGETYAHPEDLLWWSKGGVLHGESPARIAFLRRIMEEAPFGGYAWLSTDGAPVSGVANQAATEGFGARESGASGSGSPAWLAYHGERQPRWKTYRLPEEITYTAEIIDSWEMTVTKVEGTFSGKSRVDLPGKPYVAVRFTPVAG